MYCDTAHLLASCCDAACLAHTAPGVALRLRRTADGRDVLVSSACLAARLDPCQFRSLVIVALTGQTSAVGQFDAIDVVGGMMHLGGGLYQPSHPGGTDERWFVTGLGHEHVATLLGNCPHTAGIDAAFSVNVKPDPALRRSAVRLRCHDRSASRQLDEVALWAISTCLVAELIDDVRST